MFLRELIKAHLFISRRDDAGIELPIRVHPSTVVFRVCITDVAAGILTVSLTVSLVLLHQRCHK